MYFLKIEGPKLPIFSNIIPRVFCGISWMMRGWVVNLPKYLHKDQCWQLLKVEGPYVSFLQTYDQGSFLWFLKLWGFHLTIWALLWPLASPAPALFKLFQISCPFCHFLMIFRLFLKYPFLHIHKHKNTYSLALLVSFWFIWSNFGLEKVSE